MLSLEKTRTTLILGYMAQAGAVVGTQNLFQIGGKINLDHPGDLFYEEVCDLLRRYAGPCLLDEPARGIQR